MIPEPVQERRNNISNIMPLPLHSYLSQVMQLLQLTSALMSSSMSPSSSTSSLMQLLNDMRNRDYSTLPATEHSFLLFAMLPALSKVLVDPNGRAANLIGYSTVACGGDEAVGDREVNKHKRTRIHESSIVVGNTLSADAIIDTSILTTKTLQLKMKKQQQIETPTAETTPLLSTMTPAYHVPPENLDTFASSSISSSSYSIIRHAALRLLEHLTVQLLLSRTPGHPSNLLSALNCSVQHVVKSGCGGSNIESSLFLIHAPSIVSIAISVMLEDTEPNALLANGGLLVLVLRGYNSLLSKSSANTIEAEINVGCNNGHGGEDGCSANVATRMLRECQALLYFVVGCYQSSSGLGCEDRDNGKSTRLVKGVGSGGSEIISAAIGGGTTSLGDGVSLPTPVNKLQTKNNDATPSKKIGSTMAKMFGVMSSVDFDAMETTFHKKVINCDSNYEPVNAKTTAKASFLSTSSSINAASIESYRSYRLLSEIPLTIMMLLQLYPLKLASKYNMSSLIQAMMGFLLSQSTALSRSFGCVDGMTVMAREKGLSSKGIAISVRDGAPKSIASETCISTPPSAHIVATPTKEKRSLSSLHQLQMHQLPLVSCQVKIVSFNTKLLLLLAPSSRSGCSSPLLLTVAVAAEATLNLFEDSCATCVLQLLRCTSSSWLTIGGNDDSSMATTAQKRRHLHRVIQLRMELLANTRHLLLTRHRRGFFRHVDAMLDERLLIGSNNARISTQIVDGSAVAAMLTGGFDLSGNKNNDVDLLGMGGGLHTISFSEAFLSFASLQPLGYYVLAEFITQIRTKLSAAQLSRTIRIFSRVLHNDLNFTLDISGNTEPNFLFPHSTMQISATKLLLQLPEIIFHNRDPNPQVGRDLIFRILRSCVHKLEVVQSWIPDLMHVIANFKYRKKETHGHADGNGIKVNLSSLQMTIISNLQQLLRPIFHGMKTLFWCISSYSHQRDKERQRSSLAGEESFPLPAHYAVLGSSNLDNANFLNEELNSGNVKMTIGERELIEEFFRVGMPCLRIFLIDVSEEMDRLLQPWDDETRRFGKNGGYNGLSEDEKTCPGHREVLESFAVSFTSLESYNFRIVISRNLSFLQNQFDIEEDIIVLFSHLMITTGKAVSYEFLEVVLEYLMVHVGELGEYEMTTVKETPSSTSTSAFSQVEGNARKFMNTKANSSPVLTKRAQYLSKLFQLAFSSLLKYPRNENAFLPYLKKLVKECVQRAMGERPSQSIMGTVCHVGHEIIDLAWPGPYLNILRILFRTISGKFDA